MPDLMASPCGSHSFPVLHDTTSDLLEWIDNSEALIYSIGTERAVPHLGPLCALPM